MFPRPLSWRLTYFPAEVEHVMLHTWSCHPKLWKNDAHCISSSGTYLSSCDSCETKRDLCYNRSLYSVIHSAPFWLTSYQLRLIGASVCVEASPIVVKENKMKNTRNINNSLSLLPRRLTHYTEMFTNPYGDRANLYESSRSTVDNLKTAAKSGRESEEASDNFSFRVAPFDDWYPFVGCTGTRSFASSLLITKFNQPHPSRLFLYSFADIHESDHKLVLSAIEEAQRRLNCPESIYSSVFSLPIHSSSGGTDPVLFSSGIEDVHHEKTELAPILLDSSEEYNLKISQRFLPRGPILNHLKTLSDNYSYIEFPTSIPTSRGYDINVGKENSISSTENHVGHGTLNTSSEEIDTNEETVLPHYNRAKSLVLFRKISSFYNRIGMSRNNAVNSSHGCEGFSAVMGPLGEVSPLVPKVWTGRKSIVSSCTISSSEEAVKYSSIPNTDSITRLTHYKYDGTPFLSADDQDLLHEYVMRKYPVVPSATGFALPSLAYQWPPIWITMEAAQVLLPYRPLQDPMSYSSTCGTIQMTASLPMDASMVDNDVDVYSTSVARDDIPINEGVFNDDEEDYDTTVTSFTSNSLSITGVWLFNPVTREREQWFHSSSFPTPRSVSLADHRIRAVMDPNACGTDSNTIRTSIDAEVAPTSHLNEQMLLNHISSYDETGVSIIDANSESDTEKGNTSDRDFSDLSSESYSTPRKSTISTTLPLQLNPTSFLSTSLCRPFPILINVYTRKPIGAVITDYDVPDFVVNSFENFTRLHPHSLLQLRRFCHNMKIYTSVWGTRDDYERCRNNCDASEENDKQIKRNEDYLNGAQISGRDLGCRRVNAETTSSGSHNNSSIQLMDGDPIGLSLFDEDGNDLGYYIPAVSTTNFVACLRRVYPNRVIVCPSDGSLSQFAFGPSVWRTRDASSAT